MAIPVSATARARGCRAAADAAVPKVFQADIIASDVAATDEADGDVARDAAPRRVNRGATLAAHRHQMPTVAALGRGNGRAGVRVMDLSTSRGIRSSRMVPAVPR